MTLVGILLVFGGGIMFLLEITGRANSIPVVADLNWSPLIWFGIMVVGAVVYFLFRRPGD